MTVKRKVEIFSAGCPMCAGTVAAVSAIQPLPRPAAPGTFGGRNALRAV